MIGRLFLVLLLALGAMPAAAMPVGCHGAAGMAAMAMPVGDSPRHDHPATVDHGCVGCAALGDWLAERVAAPPIATAAAPQPVAIRFVLRAAGPPRLPPPRIG